MKANSYEMIIWWSVEDEAYVVDVPELPGCMAHGATRQEAIKNAEAAIKFWVKTAKEDGGQIVQQVDSHLRRGSAFMSAHTGIPFSVQKFRESLNPYFNCFVFNYLLLGPVRYSSFARPVTPLIHDPLYRISLEALMASS